MRVEELARWLEAEFEGDGAIEIAKVADVAVAGENELAFVYGKKATKHAEGSHAGCLLVPMDFPVPAARTVIRVSDPRSAFVKTVGRFHPPRPPKAGVHPSAVVSPTAELAEGVSVQACAVIGDRTKVGPGSSVGAGCSIGDDVQIGAGSLLHDNVTVYRGTTIGDNVVIHSGAVLGADGFGFVLSGEAYEKFPQIGSVKLGNNVEIGANSCVDRAALGVTSIGDWYQTRQPGSHRSQCHHWQACCHSGPDRNIWRSHNRRLCSHGRDRLGSETRPMWRAGPYWAANAGSCLRKSYAPVRWSGAHRPVL